MDRFYGNLKYNTLQFHEILISLIQYLDLNDASGQFILFMGAIVLIDVFLSVFAFGFLNQESSKKYRRQGFRSPYHAHGLKPVSSNPFRRKPSALAITLRRKIQQALRPKRPLYRQYGKRSVESEIEREDVFRPTFDYEFDDSQAQQRFESRFYGMFKFKLTSK